MSDDMIHHGSSATGKHENLRSMQEVAMNDRNASEMLRTY
ncbi:MAG: arginine decarboxylase, partial [Pseudomonadota bacterium]|nr:arginine decarboxylase [Pseudomonadota bacterium]